MSISSSISLTRKPILEGADLEQHAYLLDMIVDTLSGIENVNYDAIYEDLLECMDYKENVTFLVFLTNHHSLLID